MTLSIHVYKHGRTRRAIFEHIIQKKKGIEIVRQYYLFAWTGSKNFKYIKSKMSESNENLKREAQEIPEESSSPVSKKMKMEPLYVLTFTCSNDKFANLQLLSTHSLYDLIDTLCNHTPVGYNGEEKVWQHMWHLTVNQNTKYGSEQARDTKLDELNLPIGSILKLTYDYGTTSYYKIHLKKRQEYQGDEEGKASYPKNDPQKSLPAGYEKYVPNQDINLDAMFPNLYKWIFEGHGTCDVDLFQAGKKRNYGFMDKNGRMLFLPAKPLDLMNWLGYFDKGAKIKPSGCYTWQSVVILPRRQLTQQLIKKYRSRGLEAGFCDAPIVSDIEVDQITKLFPNIAALAGLKKHKKIKKGWIRLNKRGKRCNLTICFGDTGPSFGGQAPKGTAFDGQGQHSSVEKPLFEVPNADISGLHDLFCVVEGLLTTLL